MEVIYMAEMTQEMEFANERIRSMWELVEKLPDIPSVTESGWQVYRDPEFDGESRWKRVYDDPDGDFQVVVSESKDVVFPPHSHGSKEYLICAKGKAEVGFPNAKAKELTAVIDDDVDRRVLIIPENSAHNAAYGELTKIIAIVIPTNEGL
jgi:hypothetical protein